MLCSDSAPITVGALATAIAQNRSEEDIVLLAALFTQLGDSLALIAAARACSAAKSNPETKPS